MNIEEEIAQQIREHLVGADGGADSRTIAAALMPLVKRAQAEARAEGWEAAAHRVIAMVDSDGMIDQHRVVFMTNPYAEPGVPDV